MKKNVFVCVDDSFFAKAAIDYGIYLAKSYNYELTFIHIVEEYDVGNNLYGLVAGGVAVGEQDMLIDKYENLEPNSKKKNLKAGEEILKNCVDKAKSEGIEAKSILREGVILDTLLEYKPTTTLFIIGIRGSTEEEIGFNTAVLMKELNAPLFIVNKDFQPINTILIAVDEQIHSVSMLEFINANPLFDNPSVRRHVVTVNSDKKKAEEILIMAKSILRDSNAVFVNLEGSNPATEILNYRRTNNIDLVAVGSLNKGFFKRLIVGSVSESIVENALVPIVVIPEADKD